MTNHTLLGSTTNRAAPRLHNSYSRKSTVTRCIQMSSSSFASWDLPALRCQSLCTSARLSFSIQKTVGGSATSGARSYIRALMGSSETRRPPTTQFGFAADRLTAGRRHVRLHERLDEADRAHCKLDRQGTATYRPSCKLTGLYPLTSESPVVDLLSLLL